MCVFPVCVCVNTDAMYCNMPEGQPQIRSAVYLISDRQFLFLVLVLFPTVSTRLTCLIAARDSHVSICTYWVDIHSCYTPSFTYEFKLRSSQAFTH